ncbi:helix-turn-helix transcriptional regulator [Clostridium sp.]|uniref:helix-turn-helix domain-containing protein n=1 Tax=Clostridium sp. TaxID=1506 RepID=UPI0032168AD1
MFGDRLKELREDKNMNQDELASLVCLTRSAISSYETNTNVPSLEIAIKLADVFEVSLDYLTCRTDELYNLNTFDQEQKSIILDIIGVIKKHSNTKN